MRPLALIRLSRPHFLIGGALMYAIGVSTGDPISVGVYLAGQLAVSAAQVTAHFVNEYADFEADRLVVNRTLFSGGSGALIDTGLSRATAMRLALISSSVAIAAAVLVAFIEPVAGLLVVAALIVSWTYSMPPIRLLNTGWGELVTSLIVVVVVPIIGVLMTGAAPPPLLFWAMAVLLPVHLAMMLVFEIPDAMSDREAGKTVLAVRIGNQKTLALLAALYSISGFVAIAFRPNSSRSSNETLMIVSTGLLVTGVFVALRREAFVWATNLAVAVLVVLGATILAPSL